MIYLVVLILLLILSIHYDINRKKIGRDQWYLAMLVVFILIAGLRFRVTVDTISYLFSFYHHHPILEKLDFTSLNSFTYEPFWVILNSIVKTFGGRFFVVQIIQASIVNVIIFKFFKKHSSYPFLCIFLYYIIAYHYLCMMVMRNAIAIAICILANENVLERKWKKAYLLYFVAVMFHYSAALMMLINPVLMFLRLNKVGILLLLAVLILGSFIQSYLGDLSTMFGFVDRVSNRLDYFMENGAFSNEQRSLNYFFALVLPIFYILLSLSYEKKNHPKSNLLKLEPFVIIGLMFFILRFNVNSIHRFTRAYEPYFILFYVQFFANIYKPSNVLAKGRSLARSIIVFLPFLLVSLYLSPMMSKGYNPYVTVIERKIDREKEYHFMVSRNTLKVPSKDEY